MPPLLPQVILDNALGNAFKHGHPSDPQIRLSVQVDPPSDAASPRNTAKKTLRFTITNCAHPLRPPATPQFVSDVVQGSILSAPRRTAPSGTLGLRHMWAIAQSMGMDIALAQERELVTFRSSNGACGSQWVGPSKVFEWPYTPGGGVTPRLLGCQLPPPPP